MARVAGLRGDTMIEYKGYVGKIAVDGDELYGTVVNLKRDHVDFRGSTVAELRQAFHDSVDLYLNGCRSDGEEPEKPILGWWPKMDPHAGAPIRPPSRVAG